MILFCPDCETQLDANHEDYPHCKKCNKTYRTGFWFDWNTESGWSNSDFFPGTEYDEAIIVEKFHRKNPKAIITDFFYSDAPMAVLGEF